MSVYIELYYLAASSDRRHRRTMDDVDGPIVAKAVYERLFGGEDDYIDLEVVPHALDSAVRLLSDRGVRPSRWAPYVHIGV